MTGGNQLAVVRALARRNWSIGEVVARLTPAMIVLGAMPGEIGRMAYAARYWSTINIMADDGEGDRVELTEPAVVQRVLVDGTKVTVGKMLVRIDGWEYMSNPGEEPERRVVMRCALTADAALDLLRQLQVRLPKEGPA